MATRYAAHPAAWNTQKRDAACSPKVPMLTVAPIRPNYGTRTPPSTRARYPECRALSAECRAPSPECRASSPLCCSSFVTSPVQPV